MKKDGKTRTLLPRKAAGRRFHPLPPIPHGIIPFNALPFSLRPLG
jgi:hypothetical protein